MRTQEDSGELFNTDLFARVCMYLMCVMKGAASMSTRLCFSPIPQTRSTRP